MTTSPHDPQTRSGPRPRFGSRLVEAIDRHGPLCVGLDPHRELLERWGLPDTAEGVGELCSVVLDAATGRCAAVKPQSAFFERHGAAGIAVLEDVLRTCREQGLLTVLDVKRGDIGSTMAGYAQAYLADDAPLAADAVTLSPFLGYGSLAPAVDLARATGRGVFVLVRTSNPEGGEVQRAGDPAVAHRLMQQVGRDNAGQEPCGDVGVVVGATLDPVGEQLDLEGSLAPVLAPGVGAQGADEHDVARAFAGARGRVLVPVSRGLLGEGPDGVGTAVESWAQRLAGAVGDP
ncbi:Orotidine 5'-phosphate decarboxylase [Serinicoccus hydrothermalis]|uniref:Orotidine-5'-phosphate decarboxylase n=1 Tax=Serinicoccus hydrothermalis TaxID=1758689 RepID=A0A1B1N835_9MICO|nr:orotidine-5'-phosphate decarboxylase [Serinicoccus hydrothermalis]ANS77592.1 Orotidine 5'-phosphate decarboxylase [Serinicoccus hydrothermalis]